MADAARPEPSGPPLPLRAPPPSQRPVVHSHAAGRPASAPVLGDPAADATVSCRAPAGVLVHREPDAAGRAGGDGPLHGTGIRAGAGARPPGSARRVPLLHLPGTPPALSHRHPGRPWRRGARRCRLPAAALPGLLPTGPPGALRPAAPQRPGDRRYISPLAVAFVLIAHDFPSVDGAGEGERGARVALRALRLRRGVVGGAARRGDRAAG